MKKMAAFMVASICLIVAMVVGLVYMNKPTKLAEVARDYTINGIVIQDLAAYESSDSIYTWKELGDKTSISECREEINGKLMSFKAEDGKYEGAAYIGMDGKRSNNTCVLMNFYNKEFAKRWFIGKDNRVRDDFFAEHCDAVHPEYKDSGEAVKHLVMANDFYELLELSENKFVTREQFMVMMCKALMPVTIAPSEEVAAYAELVGSSKESAGFMSLVDNADGLFYLSAHDGSLNSGNLKQPITRLEVMYTYNQLLKRELGEQLYQEALYFRRHDNGLRYADLVNAGEINIDELQGMKKSYKENLLAAMINNPELGVTEELFNMIMELKDLGIACDKMEETLNRGRDNYIGKEKYEEFLAEYGEKETIKSKLMHQYDVMTKFDDKVIRWNEPATDIEVLHMLFNTLEEMSVYKQLFDSEVGRTPKYEFKINVEEEPKVEEEEELIEVTEELKHNTKLYNLDVAAMIADELIKRKHNLDDAGLIEVLEKADRVAEGGAADLRVGYMHGEEFNRVYTKITGEEFNKDEYHKSDYMSHVTTLSEERKAELKAEAAAEMAEYAAEIAAEKAAEAEKLEQLENEKKMLEQAAQNREHGTVKYGHLHTPEELAEMGQAGDNVYTPKYSDEERYGGPIIEGFH